MLNPFTRREFIQTVAGTALALPLASRVSLAANPVETPLHGLSSFGDLKYPEGFRHFDYASPDAPKGGTFAFSPSYWYYNQNVQTFNTLNSFVLRGAAPPRMEYCFDTLMVWAIDEPDAIYGSLAQSVTISADRNRYRFALRPQARFRDGTPVTAADAAFSMKLIRDEGHPQLSMDLRDLEDAVVIDNQTVELVFNGKQSDRAILSVAMSVPVLSSRYYAEHTFADSALTPPLGSGPWKVGRVELGLFIEYERDAEYWGKDLPFAVGLDHFDTLRIDFYAERQAAFEAFKKGNVTWREEFTSKVWATEYDFPAIDDGRVKQKLFPTELRPSLQGWAVNTRRGKFAHPKTRQGLATLFDFEWTNEFLFYSAYERSHSMFEKSDLAATGKPSDGELALLEPLLGDLPPEVFGEAVTQNITDGSGKDRSIFRKASGLFGEAGWKREGSRLVDSRGNQLQVEILIRSQVFERMLAPYTGNMRRMGIDASIRLVDPSQFQSRIEAFDFDMMGYAFSFTPNPVADSLRNYFHSESANQHGSRNFPGINDPAIDSLLGEVGLASTREELVTAMRALDRVLRAGHYWIPNWHSANHRVAYWDMFGWKEPKPDYFFPVERLWWFDAKKARAIGKA